MALANILYMNTGDGELSYANNSLLQETAIRKVIPFIKHSIKGIANSDVFKDCITVADLGCSSGPNTLLVASNIIDIVHEVCKENNRSFYGRLFRDQSLHFVHSANCNHWLFQMPQGLENNGSNIYMAKTSPPNVLHAYGKQFSIDFTKFLQMRSEEVVCSGSMVLTFPARSIVNPTSDDSCAFWELLGQSLIDMLKEGLVQGSNLNSFNIPLYFPCEDEVRNAIEYEGSFSLKNLNVFKLNLDPHDTDYINMNDSNELSQIHGKNTSNMLRVALEPLLVSHFGSSIIDVLFKKFEKHVAEYLFKKKIRHFFVTITLTKK
ncbi:putative salicylate carboxymethyltransferase [Helianthus annuus]|nr:putative salicylate carboxymethyltransferase [Helianthus annuus]